MTYLKELEQGFSEFRKNMVNFVKQTIGTEQWSPAFKDCMGDLEDTVVDLWVIGGEPGDEILKSSKSVARLDHTQGVVQGGYPHQSKCPIAPRNHSRR